MRMRIGRGLGGGRRPWGARGMVVWLTGLSLAGLATGIGVLGSAAAFASPPSSAIRYVYDADQQLKAVVNPASETALYSRAKEPKICSPMRSAAPLPLPGPPEKPKRATPTTHSAIRLSKEP